MNGILKNVIRLFGGGDDSAAMASGAGSQEVKYLTHEKIGKEKKLAEEQRSMGDDQQGSDGPKSARFLGSLKDALAAAGRDETSGSSSSESGAKAQVASGSSESLPPPPPSPSDKAAGKSSGAPGKSAAEAAREARAETTAPDEKAVDTMSPPTTRVVKPEKVAPAPAEGSARTQLVRGKQAVERGAFQSDPVVGWLVIVGGPGIGAYRPIFEGNNAIGRSSSQRIALDFGDESISSEEQAYIRYDSSDRSFLFVPNLAKTNVVSLNNKRPTGAVELVAMDVITMGRTQLVFVPFCGQEFDWAELADSKS